MPRNLLAIAAVATLTGGGVCAAAPITYHVDQTIGLGSVVGTIQTDGATGTLSAADITGWNLELNGVGAMFNLNTGNSGVFVVGADVTATTSDLFFNFSDPANGSLLFQVNYGNGSEYYCDATALSLPLCYQGATVTPQSINDPSAQHVPEVGNQIIGVAAVPEPATWAMMLAGLAGVGAAIRLGARRKVAVALS